MGTYDDSPRRREKNLGDEAVVELQRILGERSKPIPKDASDEEKYEMAYSNWIWKASSAFSFVRRKLGEAGFLAVQGCVCRSVEK